MNDSTTRSAAGPPPESDAIAPAPPPPPAEGEVRAEARSRWRRVPWFAFGTIVLGSAFASVLALFAASAWLADLAVHFRVQYLATGGLALGVLAIRRSLALTVAALATIALNAGPVAGLLTAAPLPSTPAAVGVPLTIASSNVFFLNHDHAATVAWARRARPDVLLFIEVTAEWRRGLAPLETDYPYFQYVTDQHHDGLLLFSRWPLTDVVTRADDAGPEPCPVIFATLTRDGRPLRLAAIHSAWPMRPTDARQRNQDLAVLAAAAARRGPLPFIGIGDLNISPFSPHFQDLLREGGLRNAATGFGWLPTWPAPAPFLGIQIDHALVSPEVEVRRFERGPSNGSDHLAIMLSVSIPPQPQPLTR
ncbi:MAG: endonuclease/exonuclease/phosphatase family protein [Steroidobacteraceae bacterium]